MKKLRRRKIGCAVLGLCAAMSVVAQAQDYIYIAALDGDPVYASLIQGRDGFLYGTTNDGGAHGAGKIFKMNTDGTLSTLYSFCVQPNCVDGQEPEAGLVQAADGNIYGTTGYGGAYNGGTIFKLTPTGEVTVVYNFCSQANCADGATPYAPLFQGTDGLYGTTSQGGAHRTGTVFRFTTEGKLTSLYSFCSVTEWLDRTGGNCADGGAPKTGVIQASDGSLYGGTSWGGGVGQGGTIFRINPAGELTTLHRFHGQDGKFPNQLVEAADASLYGTTYLGGPLANLCCDLAGASGTVFRITVAGEFRTLYSFCSAGGYCTDGADPAAALVQGTDGNFYGTTYGGGSYYEFGTVFTFTLAGLQGTLHSFNDIDGNFPEGALTQDTNGAFYGLTTGGGNGTAFSEDVGLGPFVAFVLRAGKVGGTVQALGQGFTGTTSVEINGVPANFNVVSDTYLTATVPTGATTGYVTVTTPTGILTSNVPFRVIK